MANITIDGKAYDLESLSENARAKVASLQAVNQEIAALQAKMAMTQTARNVYARNLANNLPEKEATTTKDVLTIDGKKYHQADLSETARKQLVMLRLADKKRSLLQAELALAQTAGVAYGQALKAELMSGAKMELK